jgi:hypothetical protein
MPEQQITYPASAYGYAIQGYRRTAPFLNSSGVAIAAKRAVSYDGTGITLATTGITGIAVIGVTLDPVGIGMIGQVVLEGEVIDMPSTGAIAANALIKRSTATAGFVEDATANPALGEILGHAITAAASNLVKIWVRKDYGDAA